jgi:hypothetical protein
MSFCCYNNQKQLARNGVKGVIISTVNVKARPETVLIDANDEYVLMTYDTIYDALLGHTYWCSEVADAINKNHHSISDARCAQITLKPHDENDPDYLVNLKISADCVVINKNSDRSNEKIS